MLGSFIKEFGSRMSPRLGNRLPQNLRPLYMKWLSGTRDKVFSPPACQVCSLTMTLSGSCQVCSLNDKVDSRPMCGRRVLDAHPQRLLLTGSLTISSAAAGLVTNSIQILWGLEQLFIEAPLAFYTRRILNSTTTGSQKSPSPNAMR